MKRILALLKDIDDHGEIKRLLRKRNKKTIVRSGEIVGGLTTSLDPLATSLWLLLENVEQYVHQSPPHYAFTLKEIDPFL
jgi:hypothetical protein